ncbi:hypothetical protein LX97_01082 [Nonlabens dokdonensis]|uniref:Signal peptide protein n=2 Tax=Nonlabens dokdonensis TaxID=328515 RepID=L7W9B1_NONDD|nr:hypothetical protein [Nonlabens dokdonensis]AGC76416.1 signal peptide protein [Nonlabens dokdonensis DSW-6]PZX44074.1 hypothetical protein LX97_01082 [Nonlabens dokdonensis]
MPKIIKRAFIIIIFTLLAIMTAALYGALHDQISYSISPEYFTKLKFQQFGLNEYGLGSDRMNAAVVGILSTWWTGLFGGLIQGLVGLIQPKEMFWKSVFGAIIRTFIFAICLGLLGIVLGWFVISEFNTQWLIPESVIDRKAFLTVGTMHTSSYAGGLIGLMIGIIYQVKLKIKYKSNSL